MKISITIANKIATADNPPTIVCGNSDYTIAFNFDSAWNEYALKTARFSYVVCGSLKRYIDVVFSGNECSVPVLYDIDSVNVGVYAGDLHTTTPAVIPCERSILCGGGVHDEPTEDVYHQIMEALKALQVALVVTELPEVGEENKTYLVVNPNGEANNQYYEYMWVNGAWEFIGGAGLNVDLTDYVKNTDYASADVAGVVKVNSGYGLSLNKSSGVLAVQYAHESEIDSKHNYRAINAAKIDYAVKKGLCDSRLAGTDYAWTDDEKAAARELLGAVGATDYPDTKMSTAGVIKVDQYYGFTLGQYGSAGALMPVWASNVEIDAKNDRRFINAKNFDYAVKKGITTNTETLTDEEKTAACEWLGAIEKLPESANNEVPATKYNNALGRYSVAVDGYHQAGKYTIPCRTSFGGLYLPDTAVNANADIEQFNGQIAVNKNYVDTNTVKKETVTSGVKLYGENQGGTFMYSLSNTPDNYSVAQRGAGGVLAVATPTADNHATTKSYVDAATPFIATYGETTYEEIKAAVDAGRMVFLSYFDMGNTSFFSLCRHTVNVNPLGYSFSCVYPLADIGKMMLGYANINEAGEWSQAWKTIALE